MSVADSETYPERKNMPSTQHLAKEGHVTGKGVAERVSPFNRYAREYDEWFTGEGRRLFAIELKAFREVLSRLPKPWLEIGVGSGRFAQALGIETGVDPSVKLVRMARSRGVSAFLARGEERLFEEGSFGTVFLIVTLCFLDRPLGVLQQARRVLMPNGRIVLGLVLSDSPWGQFYRQRAEQGHRFYRHATFYSYDELGALLRTADLRVERVVSALLQRPGEVERVEEPYEGYLPNAGFIVVVAAKAAKRSHAGVQWEIPQEVLPP